MDKTLFILIAATDGGAVGFDCASGEWIRVTTDGRRAPEELKGFSALDKLSLSLGEEPAQPCLKGDRLYAGSAEKVGKAEPEELARLRTDTAGGKIFGSAGKTATASEYSKLKSVYALLFVTDFAAAGNDAFGGAPNRCSFGYCGAEYRDFVLSDPDFRADCEGGEIRRAFVAVNLAPDPLKEGRFIKTAFKIIPLPPEYSLNTAVCGDFDKCVTFYKEGYFFTAFDADAVLLNGLFGYKLVAGNRPKTGVPVAGARTVAARLKEKGVGAVFRDERGRGTNVELIPRAQSSAEKPQENQKDGEYALTKRYIDLILKGINPVTMREIPETDVTRQPEVITRLNFICTLLGGADGGEKRRLKRPFYLDKSVAEKYVFSSKPVALSVIINRINELSDTEKVFKLKFASVADELVKRGILRGQTDENGVISGRVPTEEGEKLGISTGMRSTYGGEEREVTLFNEEAQKYVLRLVAELFPE